MSLSNSLGEHVRACFTGLYVHSHEPDEALAEIRKLCQAENWQMLAWDALAASTATAMRTRFAIAALRGFSEPDSSLLLVLRAFIIFSARPRFSRPSSAPSWTASATGLSSSCSPRGAHPRRIAKALRCAGAQLAQSA